MSAQIPSIVAQMTLREKAALCTGATSWTTTPIERLGVPELVMTDGPHGVRRTPSNTSLGERSLPATCFPTASALASSWDTELLAEMGRALAKEAKSLGVDMLLGPGVNMKRTPLCGRNFEYFSEDPFLAGVMAVALIDGIQSQGVGTSLKHFAANNQEYQRFNIDAQIDERTLREIYLPAFEMAVKGARPWTVMCAYNKLNGMLCSENHRLLVEILKEEWGFEGLVVSDWGAVRDRVKSLQGGLDLEMPGPKARRTQAVIDAVLDGDLNEAVLNESVRRILRIVFMAAAEAKESQFDIDAHHTLARRIAGESMVLLKNDGLLPLDKPQRLAVIGRAAKEPHFQGGGSSHINPTRVDIPLDELAALLPETDLRYAEGYPANASLRPDLIDEAMTVAQDADIAVLFIALPTFVESEGYDRPNLNLTEQQIRLIKAVGAVQPQTAVVINSGSAVAMSSWIDDVNAVLQGWMGGQAGGGAVAEILTGKLTPSGKLAETFPLKEADLPAAINFPGELGAVRYGEGLFIGYRYYDAKEMPVLFPFGHGLSYTNFDYANIAVSAQEFDDVDGVTVSVDVTNTGTRAGKEIVQVYVHDQASTLVRPHKELKGFAKVSLEPGETKTVQIPLDFRAFAYYHPGHKQWISENGEFEILVGASSADLRGRATVTLRSTLELPSLLTRESTIKEWIADPRGRVATESLLAQIQQQMQTTLGGGEDDGGIGMDMMGFLADMPLLSVLNFQDAAFPVPPEQMIDSLLVAVHAGDSARIATPA
jgi:beta-glucosidase